MAFDTLYFFLGCGGLIGIIGLIWPEAAFYFFHFWSGKKYDKKLANKYRLQSAIFLVMALIIYLIFR